MKLYDCSTAPSPRRARIFLAEKGIKTEVIQVDLKNKGQCNPEFLKINPRAAVPVLELDDGTVITENEGIAQYLEAAYPEPPLLGVTPVERGQVAMWNAIIEFDGFIPAQNALRNRAKGLVGRACTGPTDYEQIPALSERGLARTKEFFTFLNNRLSDREFIAIDQFSMADISAVVIVDFAKWVKVNIEDHQTHLRRWYDLVSVRPSMKS